MLCCHFLGVRNFTSVFNFPDVFSEIRSKYNWNASIRFSQHFSMYTIRMISVSVQSFPNNISALKLTY